MKLEKQIYNLITLGSALFTFCFCYLLINPVLHHHYQQIAWQNDILFLKNFLTFPGGPSEYIALFVSQFFYSNFLGSVIVALSGFLISFFLVKIIFTHIEKFSLTFFFIPLTQIIVLALMCDYRFHFSITLNLFIVVAFLYVCKVIDNKASFSISYQTYVAGILLYYISGGIYFLIFMASSLILDLRKPERKMLINAVIMLTVAFLIPFIAYHFVFLSSLNNSFFRSTPDVAAMLRYSRPPVFYAALAAIPMGLLVTGISDRFQSMGTKRQATFKDRKKSKPKNNNTEHPNINKRKIAVVLQVIVLLTLTGIILFLGYKPIEKTKVEIDYYAVQQNWDKVITLSTKMEGYDRMVNFQYNRALSNKGQLLEKLFEYNQILGSQGLFLDKPFTSEVALPNSDIYFDLGNIDESQRYAFESETLMKNSPRVLKRLIINCIIMTKMDAASTYINILAANPMERNWVKKYREFISNPKLADSDPLIVQKRKDMSKTVGMLGTPPLKLLSQLEKNPANKTAFEYLIAIDLMEHDVASLTEDLKYLGQFKYDKLPTALEEAIILYRTQGKNNVLFNMIRISEPTTERFREFAKLTSAAKGDREKAKQATLAFKNTYWYYVLFLSPRVTNLKLDTKPVDANY